MDVQLALVTDCQSPEPVEPREAALDYPSMLAEFLTGFEAPSGDAGLHLTTMARAAAATVVVGLVGMQLVRSASRTAALARNRRDSVEQVFEGHAVVDVGPGQDERERDAPAVGNQVTFGAGPAAIRGVRTCRGTPLFAAMDELSTQARLQSMRSASRSRRSNSRCRRSHTPAACQSRSRRQQVTPDPQRISAGSISQGIPVRRTKRMPLNAARDGIQGRPPFGFGEVGGSSGSMISQSESDTRGTGIHPA